jgi:hypothetical protein
MRSFVPDPIDASKREKAASSKRRDNLTARVRLFRSIA